MYLCLRDLEQLDNLDLREGFSQSAVKTALLLSSVTHNHYAAAVAAVRGALTRRAWWYKLLIIVIIILVCASISGAIFLGSWYCLPMLLLLPSAVLIFCAVDGTVVARWRGALLTAWSAGNLRIDILIQTLRQVPGLPPATLEGMLQTLPNWPAGDIPLSYRSIVVQVHGLISCITIERFYTYGFIWTFTAAVLMAAIISQAPVVLSGLLFLPLAALMVWAWQWQRIRSIRVSAMLASEQSGVDWNTACEWLGALDWRGVPAQFKTALLAMQVKG